jgi:hypothetical protein
MVAGWITVRASRSFRPLALRCCTKLEGLTISEFGELE